MQALALLPLAGIAALLWAMRRRAHDVAEVPQGARGKVGWARAYFAYLAFPVVWCLIGFYGGGVWDMLLYVVVCVACAVATMWRWDLARVLAGMRAPAGLVRALRDAVVLFASTWLTLVGMELVWNERALSMDPTGTWIEMDLIGLFLLALYFAAQRRGVAAAVGSAALYVVGMANGFVLAYKGEVIMPSDLLALGTAASVGGGLHFELGGRAFLALAAQAVATCLTACPLPCQARAARAAGRLSCAWGPTWPWRWRALWACAGWPWARATRRATASSSRATSSSSCPTSTVTRASLRAS